MDKSSCPKMQATRRPYDDGVLPVKRELYAISLILMFEATNPHLGCCRQANMRKGGICGYQVRCCDRDTFDSLRWWSLLKWNILI